LYYRYLYYIANESKRKDMKKTFKVLTETNTVRFFEEYSESRVRLKCYQLFGSELFTIKQI
jgi:hypothetical protein